MLLVVLVCVAAWCQLRFLWSRRKFYQLSWRMPGPIAYPLIGNAAMFLNPLGELRRQWICAVTRGLITTLIYAELMKQLDAISVQYSQWFRFWLGTRLLVMFQAPELFEVVMNSPHAMDKGAVYKIVGNSMGGNGLITSSDNEWKVHRKLLNPTIQNFRILSSFYPIFNRNMRIMVERMQARCGGGQFDAYEPMEACSLDMICETTFGIKMNVQSGENQEFLLYANRY